jgi:predicted transcriptional regulator
MQKKLTEDEEINMLAAAFLTGERKTQDEIAELLGLKQVMVSRLLTKGGNEYLHKETRFLQEKISPELMDKILKRVSRSNLIARLNHTAIRNNQVRGPVLRVFHCNTPVTDIPGRMAEFGRQAAPYEKRSHPSLSPLRIDLGKDAEVHGLRAPRFAHPALRDKK